jgi:hypothetical protein
VIVTGKSHFDLRSEVRTREFHDELVVLDLVAGEYFSLDALGAEVWAQLSRGSALEEIVDALATRYDVEVVRFRADLFAFVDDLVRRGLMVERILGG